MIKKNSAIDTYHKLSPQERIMVQVLAVNVLPMRQKGLVACLERLDVKDSNNQAYGARPIQAIVKHWVEAGVVEKKPTGIACHRTVRYQAVIDAALDRMFEGIEQAINDIIPREDGFFGLAFIAEDIFFKRLQTQIFTNQGGQAVSHAWSEGWQLCPDLMFDEPPFLSFFIQPFRPDLFGCLEPSTRAAALMYAVVEADRTLVPVQDLIEYSIDFLMGQPGLVAEKLKLMEYLLLRGMLDAHGRLLEGLEALDPENFAAHMGWRLMMTGENEIALDYFSQSLKLLKKRTRKRKIFLYGLPGIFFLFARLKSNDTRQYQEGLTDIQGALREETLYEGLLFLLEHLFDERLGHTVTLADPDMHGPEFYSEYFILTFLSVLIISWIDPEEGKSEIRFLKDFKTQTSESGHLWLKAECTGLLARLGVTAVQNRKTAEMLHRQCRTQSLVEVVTVIPEWEKKLNALIHLGQSESSGRENKISDSTQRLIWLLDYDQDHQLARIVPRLQKQNKTKSWTKGRAVALKNLYENHRKMAYLTDQDRQVCQTIEENTYRTGYYRYGYTRTEYEFDIYPGLKALAGHPLIFAEGALETPLELVLAEPALRLRTLKKHIQMVMDPVPEYDGSEAVLIQDAPTRFKLVCFSKKHNEMALLLGEKGLSLPLAAKENAVTALTSLTSLARVDSDFDVVHNGEAEDMAADPTPHVHIMPWQDGISMAFWVKPFGETGSFFRPGHGGVHVFAEVGGKKMHTHRDLDRERMLSHEIAALCPSLDHLVPVSGRYEIDDPAQALEVLQELQECRDKVRLEWPQGKKLMVKTQVSFNDLTLAIKKDRDWFKATGKLTLDTDTQLDLKQLVTLINQATGRFIPLDDTTYVALTQSLKDRLDEFKSYSVPHGNGLRFAPLAGPAIETLTENAGELKADRAWKKHCKKLKEIITPILPGTLQADLRPYQKEGFNWLAQLVHWQVGACLADDMGLGKTLQALAAALLQASNGPSLVVAPLSVIANWQDECHRFAPTLVPRVFGPGDRQVFLDDLGPFDLVISSYGLLQTEIEKLAGVTWQMVVLDEAQAIKNMNSKRSRAAMKLEAGFRLITTGTPVENHLGELWTLFQFLNPGLLGPFKRFRENFILPIERDHDKQAALRLKNLIRPFILRRMKSDVLKELPEKTEVTLQVEMSPQEETLYEAHRQAALDHIEGGDYGTLGQKHLKILAELMRLRQLCCNPDLVVKNSGVESSKLKVFSNMVDELLENRHKALVFSQFVGHLKILRQFLDTRKITYQYLDGSTPAKERQKRINAFQSGQGDLFLISLKAGGSGLNLTAADYVIHMDPWWNPAVEDQASDRAHRIGQTRPVTVYRLVVKDSIEEKIIDLHNEKRDLAESLLSGSDTAAKMTAGELLALLTP